MADENKKPNKLINQMDQFSRGSAELENFESILARHDGSREKNSQLLGVYLNYLPNPFYVIDASDYTVKAMNSAAQFSSMPEVSTCYALTHKRDSPCGSSTHPCPIEIIKETKKPLAVEHLHYDRNGNPRNVEIHAFPVFDNEEKVSHIIEYVQDITERKQAESALKWELSVNAALSQLYEPLVSPGASIETIASIVLEQAKIMTESEHGYVSSISPNGDNVSHTLTEMLKGQCGVAVKNKKTVFPKGKDGNYSEAWRDDR